jgi:hypothetical protein
MLFCPKHKLAFVSPVKTGSRAVWYALKDHFGTDLEEPQAIQIMPMAAERDPKFQDYQWICSVRNPYRRLLSWYFYKRFWSLRFRDTLPEYQDDLIPVSWLTDANHLELALGPNPYDWADKSLAECLRNEDNRGYCRQSLALGRFQKRLPIDRLTLVRQENLEAELQQAHPALANMPVPRVEVNKHRPYPAKDWAVYFQEPDTIPLVQKIFSSDFEWLSNLYTREFPGEI